MQKRDAKSTFVITMILLVGWLGKIQADTSDAFVRESLWSQPRLFGRRLMDSSARLMTGRAPNIDLKKDSPTRPVFESDAPTRLDVTLVLSAGVLWTQSEFIIKDDLAPKTPRWTTPGALDTTMRNWLLWQNPKTAGRISNYLFRGLFVPSVLWTPLLISKDQYASRLMIGSEALFYNAMLNQAVKFAVGRQRPSSYFNDIPRRKGGDEYLSFYSGHSAISFGIATSTAYLLSDTYPRQDWIIWSSAFVLASSVAYLRVAADRHYFTDVLVGAVIGSAIGHLIAHQRTQDWLLGESETVPTTSPSGRFYPDTEIVLSKTISF